MNVSQRLDLGEHVLNGLYDKIYMKTHKPKSEDKCDKVHKIGKHGAVGFVTPEGSVCAECNKPIDNESKEMDWEKRLEYLFSLENQIGAGLASYGGDYPSPFSQAKHLVKQAIAQERERIAEVRKTLVVIPKGYQYVEVLSAGDIKVKAIKSISNGSEYDTVIIDELKG